MAGRDRIPIRETWLQEDSAASPLAEISTAMVRLYKDAFGRGPRKSRAQYAGPNTLVVVLEHTLTVSERNLAAMGNPEKVREARLFIQHAMEDQFRSIVERALDRRTVAFVSGIDIRNDVSVELFTLEPLADPTLAIFGARSLEAVDGHSDGLHLPADDDSPDGDADRHFEQ
jgi:uncharacterized protein YbcI